MIINDNKRVSSFFLLPTYIHFSAIDFSKKTGDFANLSAIDIKVLALTYIIELEANCDSNLRKKPSKPDEIRKGLNKSNKKR